MPDPIVINYAQRYSNLVDERFRLGSLTNSIVNQSYSWIDVDTVKIFSIPVVSMNDYSLSGTNRYGDPSELGNSVQTLTIEQDRSFTFTIDLKSEQDTMGVMAAGAALRRQIDEVVIPEIDAYRIAALVTGAGNSVATEATKSNAYEVFLNMQEQLDEDKAPVGGRIAMVTPAFYNKIKLDPSFLKASDLGQRMLLNGQVGEVDGVPIIKIPSSYFPAGVHALITNPIATVSPIKLQDFKIHDNPPGINGFLCEGRCRYDAFVLTNKADAIVYNGVVSTT